MGIAADNNDPVETHKTHYFDCGVEVWRIKGPYWGCCPWRYSVTHEGKRRCFSGVPNYLETRRQALKKAWWRAKWLSSGEWDRHYT